MSSKNKFSILLSVAHAKSNCLCNCYFLNTFSDRCKSEKKNHKIKRYSLETFMFLSASNENVQGPSLVALCFNYRCCNIRKKNKRQQHNQARR